VSARLTILLATAIVALLAVAGCGDDDENGSDGSSAEISVTTSSLTKPQFVSKAIGICEEERQQIPTRSEAYQRTAPKDQSPEEVYEGGIRQVIVPTFQGEVEKITKLGAPKGDEAQVEALLVAQQEAIDEVTALDTIKDINQVAGHFTDANKLMRKYGLVNCMVVPEPSPSS
jgi:hypothetical protein